MTGSGQKVDGDAFEFIAERDPVVLARDRGLPAVTLKVS